MKVQNILKATLVAAALSTAASTQAAQVYFGGVTPTDGSQQTSGRAEIDWINADGTAAAPGVVTNIADPASGFFVETFDSATRNPILDPDGDLALTESVESVEISGEGCQFNSFGSVGVTATPSGAGMGIQKGNTGQAAHDNDNTTCFGYAPQVGDGAVANVTVDYSSFLNNAPLGYVGIYYGSIDTYNGISFGNVVDAGSDEDMSDGIQDGFAAINLTIDGGDYGTSLDGTEILNIMDLQSGDRDSSNVFVNILFDSDEMFTAFRLENWQARALEVDNIVVGKASAIDVPEPTSIALFGLGLLGLAARRKQA